MIWGKSPERRVVMPAGAFKFLKNDIRHKKHETKARNDGFSCPQGLLNFSKMTSGKMLNFIFEHVSQWQPETMKKVWIAHLILI